MERPRSGVPASSEARSEAPKSTRNSGAVEVLGGFVSFSGDVEGFEGGEVCEELRRSSQS